MKLFLIIFLWFGVITPDPMEIHAKNEALEEDSYLKFTIRNLGINVEGQFESFSTTVDFDKSQPSKSQFSAEIEVSSINTGIKKRDNHLKEEEYFHQEKYPKITFKSTNVRTKGSNQLLVKGDLIIKGKTLPIELEVEVSEAGGKYQFTIKGKLDRRDFGVGDKSWVMSDDVYLDLYVEN